jgi:hypothetical protein
MKQNHQARGELLVLGETMDADVSMQLLSYSSYKTILIVNVFQLTLGLLHVEIVSWQFLFDFT